MIKLIRDLWIITKDGFVVFNRVYDPRLEDNLLGSFMSALNIYSEQIIDESLSSIQIDNKVFYFLKENNFIFLGTASEKDKETKVLSELKIISEKFFYKYSDKLPRTNYCETDLFKDFKDELDNIRIPILKNPWES